MPEGLRLRYRQSGGACGDDGFEAHSKQHQLQVVYSSTKINKYPQVIEGAEFSQTYWPIGSAMVVAAPKRTAVTMRALEEGALTIVYR